MIKIVDSDIPWPDVPVRNVVHGQTFKGTVKDYQGLWLRTSTGVARIAPSPNIAPSTDANPGMVVKAYEPVDLLITIGGVKD